jgi:DNA repair exonuclease SbcCD ATPase subunit
MTVQFQSIQIENFQVIKQVDLDLNNQGSVIIRGNNGHGKTTIIDAFLWCLTGKTGKGKTADAVLNIQSPKDCKVTVTWEDSGTSYQVDRYRKHQDCPKEGSKSGVFLYANQVQQSFPSDKAVDAEIALLIGADHTTLLNTVIFGQHVSKRLPEMSTADKQALYERILDIFWVSDMQDMAKEQRQEAKDQLKEVQTQLYMRDHDMDAAKAEYRDLNSARKTRLADITKRQAELQGQIDDYGDKSAATKERIQELANYIDKFEAITPVPPPDLDHWNGILNKADEKLSALNDKAKAKEIKLTSAMATLTDKIHSAKTKLVSVNKWGPQCVKCHQDIPHIHKDHQKQELNAAISDMKSAIMANKDSLDELEKQVVSKTSAIKTKRHMAECKIQDLLSAYNDYETEAAIVRTKVSERDMLRTNLKSMTDTQAAMQDQIQSLEDSKSVDEERAAAIKDRINRLKVKVRDLKDREKGCKRQEQVLDYWYQACGTKGLKNHLIAQTVPVLNTRAEHYAQLLCNGKVQVQFEPKRETSTGAVRYGFYERVLNHRGVEEYDALSGGERQLVNLIISLSLQDLVGSRASKSINLAMVDEATDSLDSENTTAAINLLTSLSQTRGSVFVITHNKELQSLFPTQILMKDGAIVDER